MKTTTVKFQRDGQQSKFIPSAVNYKGYLCQVYQKGIGTPEIKGGFNSFGEGETWEEYKSYRDEYKPFIDSEKTSTAEKAEIKTILEKDNSADALINAGYEHALIKWGEQDGYTVTDADREKRAQEEVKQKEFEKNLIDKKAAIYFQSGYFGLTLRDRLPANIWNTIRQHAEYVKATEGDMEWLDDMGYFGLTENQVRGWYYKKEAIDTLVNAGYKVLYKGVEVTDKAEKAIAAIENEIASEKKKLNDKIFSVRKGWEDINMIIADLRNGAEYISSEEADEISSLPKFKFPTWQGSDIYGGGRWMHVKGDDLYLVYNNGHDGDDWSRNNYGTGGAGAICYKVKGRADIVASMDEYIESIGLFEVYLHS